MKDPREIILRPIVTEKTADAKENTNTVCFQVAPSANRIEIRRVQVLNVKGKNKRFGRRLGKRNDWRKAYVRLAAGEKTIEFFDQV